MPAHGLWPTGKNPGALRACASSIMRLISHAAISPERAFSQVRALHAVHVSVCRMLCIVALGDRAGMSSARSCASANLCDSSQARLAPHAPSARRRRFGVAVGASRRSPQLERLAKPLSVVARQQQRSDGGARSRVADASGRRRQRRCGLVVAGRAMFSAFRARPHLLSAKAC